MRINTNLSALNAYRNLSFTDDRLGKTLERLSSGLRINRAADDAAGLAISEKMRGQIRGLNQAMRNAMDGISLMQTAEGALNETHAILQRMRELAVQASSDTLTSSDRVEIQKEIEQLTSEIDRNAGSTEFNTKKLLDGSSAALTSTSDLHTRIFMRGGLRTIDQFGQRSVGGGNYRLEVQANPGHGEVQKTDIMKTKHAGGFVGVETTTPGSPAGRLDFQTYAPETGGSVVGSVSLTDADIALITGDLTIIFEVDNLPPQTMTITSAVMTLIDSRDALLAAINDGQGTNSGGDPFNVDGWDGLQGAYADFNSPRLVIISETSGEESSVKMTMSGSAATDIFGTVEYVEGTVVTPGSQTGNIAITDAYVQGLNDAGVNRSFLIDTGDGQQEVEIAFSTEVISTASDLLSAIGAVFTANDDINATASLNENHQLVITHTSGGEGNDIIIGAGEDPEVFFGRAPDTTDIAPVATPANLSGVQHISDAYLDGLTQTVTFTVWIIEGADSIENEFEIDLSTINNIGDLNNSIASILAGPDIEGIATMVVDPSGGFLIITSDSPDGPDPVSIEITGDVVELFGDEPADPIPGDAVDPSSYTGNIVITDDYVNSMNDAGDDITFYIDTGDGEQLVTIAFSTENITTAAEFLTQIETAFTDNNDINATVAYHTDNNRLVITHTTTAVGSDITIGPGGRPELFFGQEHPATDSTYQPQEKTLTGYQHLSDQYLSDLDETITFNIAVTINDTVHSYSFSPNMATIANIDDLNAYFAAQVSGLDHIDSVIVNPAGNLVVTSSLPQGETSLDLALSGQSYPLFGGAIPDAVPGTDDVEGSAKSTIAIDEDYLLSLDEELVFTVTVNGVDHEIRLNMAAITNTDELVEALNNQLEGTGAQASFNNLQITATDPGTTVAISGDDAAVLFGGPITTPGAEAREEIVVIGLQGATGGTYTLGDGTANTILPWNADAATVQQQMIRDLSYGEGQVTVSGGQNGFPLTITFSTDLGAPSGLTFDGSGLVGALVAVDEQQTITVEAESGTFSLTLFPGTADEVTTADINYDAPAADVQTAINAVLAGAGQSVTVTPGDDEGQWLVTFDGADFAGRPQPLIRVNTDNLFGVGRIGEVAYRGSAIFDIDRFWDANGNFLVEDPQTINLVQGDGKKTAITIFGSDTIADIESKLNQAIHEGLGQRTFNEDADSYVTYVTREMAAATDEGFFTVAGTFVIQSAVTGSDGQIRFSGNEGVINALSLTNLQGQKENEFTVRVTDAHDSSRVIAESTRIVGNLLVGVVHENVDVKFNPMAGVRVETVDNQFRWVENDIESIFIHLSDNTMVFHVGANPQQDVSAAIGDMRAESLGIDNILVTNRVSANRALSKIDYAITRVSSERAKLGALQNRLEHTINNLGVAAENLAAAESRVRDLDFALEMVEFTRSQIMMQAGTSMLAQANMQPQAVLALLQ